MSVSDALLNKTVFCGAGQFFLLGLAFAGSGSRISCLGVGSTFLHETIFGCTRQFLLGGTGSAIISGMCSTKGQA
ncbi:MAG: hypothetical protein LWW81_09200, partial [Rhodocyclales bacterium]|nr:hypothetical protein [Rhodocyclales bacterium]